MMRRIALLDAGASLRNLKGWVAGGALVGPLEKYDLELNIGGRTTEQVLAYLTSKHINIKKSETGGFFTCVLSLNLQSFECTIEPVGFEKTTSKSRISLYTEDEINHSIEKLQPIPRLH
jgi:chemotaxis receptor (MCP) glutamine deamidase CheD